MNKTQGADLTATSKSFLTRFSDSPLIPTTSCGAATLTKGMFNSYTTVLTLNISSI